MSALDSQSSSSDDTLPRVASIQSKSQRSSASSRNPRREPERQHYDGTPTRLLSRMPHREDPKHLKTLLVVANDRLESETRRADQAEQRVVEVLERLRTANETISVVRSEASRANEELRLYKLQLDNAQREILRAQDIVDQLTSEREEAERAAAHARSVARRYREDGLMHKAREEGRREGYQEGYYQAKTMSYIVSQPRPRLANQMVIQSTPYIEDDEYEDEQPEPIQVHSDDRAEQVFQRTSTPARYPSPRTRPRSNTAPSRSQLRSVTPAHMNEAAHFAPTLPVPTITTPVNAPSPFHATSSPSPAPPSRPASRRPDHDLPPLPIRNTAPSPVHPPYEVPPDNYIPYAEDVESISLPPPHEFRGSMTPIDRTPSVAEQLLDDESEQNPSYVRTRDFAYNDERDRQPMNPPVTLGGIGSPQSRTSTQISQFELIAPPRSHSAKNPRPPREEPHPSHIRPQTPIVPGRSTTPMRPSSRMGMERDIRSPMGPRDRQVPSEFSPSSSSSGTPETVSRKRADSGKASALERLFKKRYRSKRTPPEERQSLVPEIFVESPSTPASSRGSSQRTTTVPVPNLLSPDHANRPLPVPSPSDILPINVEPVQIMHYEAPAYIQVPEVDMLPPNFMPTSYNTQTRTPSRSPAPMEGYSNDPVTSSPRTPYVPAPVPPSIVYPDPPTRSMTPRAPKSPPNRTSSRARSRSDSLAGRLSPLPFGNPFPIFSPSDD
ncbi:hypothetical protein QCA50_016621 [Cerrena zonata]|uniref:Uncharacterized protein n=1 Tax=Cerrena zonata TaxID=2478898 RepID=A0AAW0FHY0_9APHY